MTESARLLIPRLALTILGLCCAREVIAQSEPQARKYALLIGVDEYEHAAMNGDEPLKYAVADVREMAVLLRDSGYEVETLEGPQARLAAIREKLKRIGSQGNARGVVLVALSGHGVQPENSEEAYYCPYDVNMQDSVRGDRVVKAPNGRVIKEPIPNECLKFTEVLDQFVDAKAGTRILLADCCRNDPTTGKGKGVGTGIKTDRLPENTAMMLSCSRGERSFEDKKWQHGAFFYHVLTGLRAGKTTVSGLDNYLEESVPAEVRGLRDAPRQTPFTLKVGGRLDFGISRGAGDGQGNHERPRHEVRSGSERRIRHGNQRNERGAIATFPRGQSRNFR